jgi:ferredoxin-type protein NapG
MAKKKKRKSDEPVNPRRSFFRQLFLRGLDKVEEAGKAIAQQVSAYVEPPKPAYTPPAYESSYRSWDASALRVLRPPGALPAQGFADTCSRCGDCVAACPARAIKLDDVADADARGGGLPYLIARESPCVICTDLSCMKACPTGALRKLDSGEQIQMGYAITDQSRCLRGGGYAIYDEPTSLTGEDCQLCVTQCPIGKDALGIDHHGCVEVRHACTGCGVCEQVCPTEPSSIWVEPW